MANVTLLELKTRSRQAADMEFSSFVQDSELVRYINASSQTLYDLLIQAYGSDYYVNNAPYEVTYTGQGSVDLPSDFYQLVGVDANVSGQFSPLLPFNFAERNNENFPNKGFRYRLQGNKMIFQKNGSTPSKIKIWYIPVMELLATDGDEIDGQNGFEELIVVDVAIKMLAKEESSTTQLEQQRARLMERIETIKSSRDQAYPSQIQNVTRRGWEWLM